MALVSGDIPNFINGVSQQPYALRLASQAQEQINGMATVAQGLLKRPPTNHVKTISGTPLHGYFHAILRDQNERYIVSIGAGAVRVFDLMGNEKTVNAPGGFGYLASPAGADANVSARTEADYTVIVNRGVTVAMTADVVPDRTIQGLIYVRQGNYATTYSVALNGHLFTYTTPADQPTMIQTDYIAGQLAAQMTTAGWLITHVGSTVVIRPATPATFTLAVTDSTGDTALLGFLGTTQSFTDLPLRAIDGYQVEITGTPANNFDNIYVQFKSDNGPNTTGTGVWIEAPRPGRKTTFDATTMPHLLTREADGTFTFQPGTWAACSAGDYVTVPEPGFVGNTINDVVFYKNRMGFLASDHLTLSRSADLFNFWRATATTILDTDPIDLTAPSSEAVQLSHALLFNESLVLFSDLAQFTLAVNQVVSPRTTGIDQTTAFEANPNVRPIGVGSLLYFVANRGTGTSVREYYVEGTIGNKDADDATAHVTDYIPLGCFRLAGSSSQNMLLALTSGDPQSVYVYQFFIQNAQKLQSAWHKWTFDGQVIHAEIIDASVFLLVNRSSGGTALERIDLDVGIKSGSLPYAVLLDRRVDESAVGCTYSAGADATTITLPYSALQVPTVVVVGSGDVGKPPGYVPQLVYWNGADGVTVKGDVSHLPIRVGTPYEHRYDLSTLVVRKPAAGGGLMADTRGRLQLHRMTLGFADSGYFRVVVQPGGRAPYTYTFTGRQIGVSAIGVAGLETGNFRFPIMCQNTNVSISVINDSHLPSRLLTGEWEAQLTTRSRSVS